jgi:hypothetical protein
MKDEYDFSDAERGKFYRLKVAHFLALNALNVVTTLTVNTWHTKRQRPRMTEAQRSMMCIATGHGDQWEAFCRDYDLAVQSSSFDEVRRFLDKAVHMYAERALELPEPARSHLLNRKAPFLVRLVWAWRLFWPTVLGRTRRDDSTIGFPVACPA